MSASSAPPEWRDALDRVAAARTTVVLGAPDVGKSRFVQAALAEAGPPEWLLDLDPGQKMVGPPGFVSLGTRVREGLALAHFAFVGTTSASAIGSLVSTAARLRRMAGTIPLIVNTAGFVRGPGIRLQASTVDALRPDLIVAIADDDELEPILATVGGTPVVKIPKSPAARRKTASERRRLRQSALDEALVGAERLLLPSWVGFEPREPYAPAGTARPVCALAGGAGEDMRIGIFEGIDQRGAAVIAAPPPREVRLIRVGEMWVEPAGGWKLLDQLKPAWSRPQGNA